MSYDEAEISVQDSAPIELYTFYRGDRVWRYTSSETDYTDTTTDPDEVYTSASIDHGNIEATREDVRNNLDLVVPRTFEIAEFFRIIAPTTIISVVLREKHRSEDQIVVRWMGRALACDFDGSKATIHCEPISSSEKRDGLTLKVSRSCQWALFGDGCTLDRADWDLDTTVTAIDGSTLTVAALDAVPYAGGDIEWVDADGDTHIRFIESFDDVTLTLTLNRPFYGIAVTDAVNLSPGCAHDMNTCDTVYSNSINYGGRPHMTTKNPMNGDGIF